MREAGERLMPRGVPNAGPATGEGHDGDGSSVVETSAPAEVIPPETPSVVASPAAVTTAPKPLTRAQRAKAEADARQAKADRGVIDAAESFVVIFPTGISLHVGNDVDEVAVSIGGVESHVDAVGGHVHLPKGALIRAATMTELADLRGLAAMRFVDPVSSVEAI